MFSAVTSGQQLLRGLLDQGYAREAGAVVNAITRSTSSGLIERRVLEFEAEAAALSAAGQRMSADNPLLRALLADLEDVMKVNARLVDGAAPNLQSTAADAAGHVTSYVTLPGQSANQLIEAGLRWNKPDPEAVARLLGFANSPEWEARINAFSGDMAGRVREIALRGIVAGMNPRTIAREVAGAVASIPRHTAETMMRTLQLQSYRRAETAFYTANAHIISHRIRIAALDARTCMSCVALHGTRLEAGEMVIDHENGRCTSIGVVKGTTRNVQTGEAWFKAQPEAQQRSQMGAAAFDAWKAGKIQLGDFVHKYKDDVFGEMAREASLKGMLGNNSRTVSIPPKPAPPAPISVRTLFDDHAQTDTDFSAVLDRMDAIHSIGPLIGTPITTKYESPSPSGLGMTLGRWSPMRNEVMVARGEPDIQGTIAHEFGHALDFRLFGGGLQYASDDAKEGRGPLAGWWSAVTSTTAYTELVDVRNSTTVFYDNAERKFAEYLTSQRELFARSYHQYIAFKSGDATLMAGINKERSAKQWIRQSQWTDSDFAVVEQAIDEIFRGRGWLK